MKKLLIVVSLLVIPFFLSAQYYSYFPLTLGFNLQQDRFNLNNGPKFNNWENGQVLYLTGSNNNAFVLAEMDFLGGWNRQTRFSTSSNDTILTNNFQLAKTVLALYTRGESKFKLGWLFTIDFSLKEAVHGVEDGHNGTVTTPKILAAASGLNLGLGIAAVQQFDNLLVVNHNLGWTALGNAQNTPNWYGKYFYYLVNATYPLTPRFAANGYLNVQYFHLNNTQRLANGHRGNILTWQLRFGVGIHIFRDGMYEK